MTLVAKISSGTELRGDVRELVLHKLGHDFQFEPGQNVVLVSPDKEHQATVPVSTLPGSATVSVVVTNEHDWLFNAEVGEKVGVEKFTGSTVLASSSHDGIFVGSGPQTASILSLAREFITERDGMANIVLIEANSEDRFIYKEKFETLGRRDNCNVQFVTGTEQTLINNVFESLSGILTEVSIEALHVYLRATPYIVTELKAWCNEHGVPLQNIHHERDQELTVNDITGGNVLDMAAD